MENSHLIISGISTNIGKTVVSAVLCEALQMDYWKPVQSGELDKLDSEFVDRNTSSSTIIPEKFLFQEPLSPHEASRIDGISVQFSDFELPPFNRPTIIEGAGGLMVPLNDEGLIYLDVFQHWNLPVFLVTMNYLGSINHTLLSIEALSQRNIPIAGLIINGETNPATERIYNQHYPNIFITRIPHLTEINPETISKAAQLWNEQRV